MVFVLISCGVVVVVLCWSDVRLGWVMDVWEMCGRLVDGFCRELRGLLNMLGYVFV